MGRETSQISLKKWEIDLVRNTFKFWFIVPIFVAELGDYDQKEHTDGYVSEFRFIPNQVSETDTNKGCPFFPG